MSGDYLDRLARMARRVRFDDCSPSALAAVKAVVLDTIGAILVGSRLEENVKLADLAAERSGQRTATIIGRARKAEPMFATLANATAGVAFEVDEGNRWGGGHPSIHVMPAALAVGEELVADGPRFIEALIAGYEVTSRLGGATRQRDNVHSHGTWGTAGAAVAVARLLGHEPASLRAVINLATSMSPANSWTPCFEGATIRNLYPGRAGLQGILAVHLLACGFTPLRDAPSDVYGTILAEHFDPELAVDGLGADDRVEVFRIERNYFKFHACCYFNHPALDAVQRLLRGNPVAHTDIAGISVTSIPFVTRMAETAPRNMLAAKFSIPYAVAAAVVRGGSFVDAFADEARQDVRVEGLAGRVTVQGDPSMAIRSDGVTARVAIALRDGRILAGETRVAHGDATDPPGRDERLRKFATLAEPVIGATRVRKVIDTVEVLETLKDVRSLTELLTTVR
ncbi:MAG: MmgE/PrpD family protein [Candidatus Rokubacteria bacterium]|nr:MmgE/PrpD family protein [Candidatus Rokubacteria bacterium]